MQSHIVPRHPLQESARLAAEVVNTGGVVLIPTDTCYGLSAGAAAAEAIRRVEKLKGREGKPFNVLLKDVAALERVATSLPPCFERLRGVLVPGPLTLVVRSEKLSFSSDGTLAVRVPRNEFLEAVMEKVREEGIISTSANPSGGAEPYALDDVAKAILQGVDLSVDAGRLPPTPPSSILDLTKEPPALLREGAVSRARIEEVLRTAVA
ncbi:MAG: threonylcarbamoyl-AMP synthase [Acidobacteriota bacterium]|nr:MAG: threonylcarbamoyl-AMP synthase [Acidobacteriota bacterium]